jgi:GxxExxY protein
MAELLYKDESYKIIGACFEVYNQKGYGFIEPVYQECLQIEFAMQNIPFVSQPEIQMSYKGTLLNQYFKPDFICYGKIIVEIKSVATILAAHRAQAINYLKATEF